MNIQDWQQRNDSARQEDQKALHDRLSELESNQHLLAEMLSTCHVWRLNLQMAYNLAGYARRATS